MHCAACGFRLNEDARFCASCGERVMAARMPAAARSTNGAGPLPREEINAAIAARHELGERLESEVTEAFLERVSHSIDARVDQRIAARGGLRKLPARAFNVTGRIVGSIAVGIPLTAVAGSIGGEYGDGPGAVIGIVGVLASILTLNIYYTESEKDWERNRRS